MRHGKQLKINANIGLILGYIYVLLPIALFFIGWCKWYVWVPGVAVIGYSLFGMFRESKCYDKLTWNRDTIIRWVFIVAIIVCWVALSGVGRLVFQNTDHEVRNGIFELLVNRPWPVIDNIDYGGTSVPRAHIYYIGFWLPAALFGKLFGVQAGYYFQVFWASLGIALMYYLVCMIRKKTDVWPLVLFIFFSGLDTIGCRLVGITDSLWNNVSIEWWSDFFQYSSNTTQLFWVFNQSVPAWITFMLLYVQKNNRYLILLASTMVLSSTFPLVGVVAFVLLFMFENAYRNKGNKKYVAAFCRSVLTIPNIVGGGVIGIVTTLYMMEADVIKGMLPQFLQKVEGIFQETVYASSFELTQNLSPNTDGDQRGYIMIMLVFLFLEAWIFCIAIYKYQKSKPVFWAMVIMLSVCPLFKVGAHSDFCMRVSIPALQMLYLLMVDTLDQSKKVKDYITIAALSVLIVIGAYTPLHEMQRTITLTKVCYSSGLSFDVENCSDGYLFVGSYVSGAAEGNVFFDYLADKKQGNTGEAQQ